MVRFIAAFFLASSALLALSHAAAPSIAEKFWHAALPDYALPDTVLWQLQPADTSSSESKDEGTSAGDDTSNTADNSKEQLALEQYPYFYFRYRHKQGSEYASHKPAADDSEEGIWQDYPFFYFGYRHKQGSDASHKPAAEDSKRGRLLQDYPFFYFGYRHKQGSSSHKSSAAGPSRDDEGHSHRATGDKQRGKMNMSAVFFQEEALQVGRSLPFYFPPARRATLGMLPRDAADSIAFSTSALPEILARLGVAAGSGQAASMEQTLSMCEAPSLAGEAKFCATSLEALVEGAMGPLGTRDIRPVTSTLPCSGAPWQPYTIRAVRPVVVGAGSNFVACHDMVYPYTVYMCHDTGLARLYMAEMEGTGGGGGITVAVICHTDTSQWDPEHFSFKLLGTKPGGSPVCHIMPYGHMIWAKNDDGCSSA